MSVASRRAVAIISIVEGCAILLERQFKTDNIAPYISRIKMSTATANCFWPETGVQTKNLLHIISVYKKWDKAISKKGLSANSPMTLVYLGLQAIDDLMIKIKNPKRRRLLDRIYRDLMELSDFIDPKGVLFDQLETADKMLIELYNIVGD